MNQPPQQIPAHVEIAKTDEYREGYANSIQVRANLWDFFLMFGMMNQTNPDRVKIDNFQGIYLSPQQAKALVNLLHQNIEQYESTFGEIRLQPVTPGAAVQ